MELLYPKEHQLCFNYDNGPRPIIEVIDAQKDQEYSFLTHDHKLFFINTGKLSLSYDNMNEVVVNNEQFFFLPSLSGLRYKAIENSKIIIIRLTEHVKLCDRFSLEKLLLERDERSDELAFLDVNIILQDFLKMLYGRLTDGLKCFYYFELKLTELLFLLRAYYKKEDLSRLFGSLLSADVKFSNFIYQNYSKAKTVKDLAEVANYSLSGFEKRFKKTFGVSAGAWLNKKRAMQIYHEINCSQKPFKNISSEYGFSSPAHFNDYCKCQFGDTPGGVRRIGNNLRKKE